LRFGYLIHPAVARQAIWFLSTVDRLTGPDFVFIVHDV
jgi:hypothetical protein